MFDSVKENYQYRSWRDSIGYGAYAYCSTGSHSCIASFCVDCISRFSAAGYCFKGGQGGVWMYTTVMSGWLKCGKAWVVVTAWIYANYTLCAMVHPALMFGCAVAGGVLCLMPDFNDAC